jgi:predicted O-methyltransferase YrrM
LAARLPQAHLTLIDSDVAAQEAAASWLERTDLSSRVSLLVEDAFRLSKLELAAQDVIILAVGQFVSVQPL